jgi:hypothetical protein
MSGRPATLEASENAALLRAKSSAICNRGKSVDLRRDGLMNLATIDHLSLLGLTPRPLTHSAALYNPRLRFAPLSCRHMADILELLIELAGEFVAPTTERLFSASSDERAARDNPPRNQVQ